jgi:hypothetical protein
MTNRYVLASSLLLTLIGGCSAVDSPERGEQKSSQVADTQTSLEEDYSYPGADQVFEQQKIRLREGDGNMLLVDCASAGEHIEVWSTVRLSPAAPYCFRVRGRTGHLSMELPLVYEINTFFDSHAVEATVDVAGTRVVKAVPAGDIVGFNAASTPPGSGTLLDLRATQ